jgi:F-type H+-transporting ATPase subunit epsilon
LDKKLTVIADTVESPDRIDRDRAEKARQRAIARLQSKPGAVNLDRARLALAKAILRLQILDA